MPPAPALIQSIDRLTAAAERVQQTLQAMLPAVCGSSVLPAKIISAKNGYDWNAAVREAEALLNETAGIRGE